MGECKRPPILAAQELCKCSYITAGPSWISSCTASCGFMSLCLHQLVSLCFWSVSWCRHARLCRCESSGVQPQTVVILYLAILSTDPWAVIGREPSSHMAKGILPNAEFSSLTPFGVICKFWTLHTFGWTSLFFLFEALSPETSGQQWSLNYKGGFQTFFLQTPWNELSSQDFP